MSTDQQFSLTTRIVRPAADVFAWHEKPGALERLCPPWERVRVTAGTGGVRDGAQVTVQNKFGPMWMEWRVEHRDYVAGRQFRDIQLSGPFARWDHLHRVEPDGPNACLLTDEIIYRLPGGGAGAAVAGALTRRKLSQLFHWRHETTKADLELTSVVGGDRPIRVLIAGASGLMGSALRPFLLTQGHQVLRLVRRPATAADEIFWDPAKGELSPAALEGVDAVVNLSGENVAAGRWTDARRDAIFRSRADATRTLVGALKQLSRKPAVFVSASAVGYYGDRGDEILTEDSSIGHGFLPEVCLAWETHAEGARKIGLRTAIVRFGVVLTPAGGALAKLLPIFRAGLGGPVGGGAQWMSWVGIDDAIGAIHHAIFQPACDGPLNVVTPGAVTNREFTRTLAHVLRRPALVPVPRVVLRAVFGEMADETLLASSRVKPERLIASGYRFRHPNLEAALRRVCGKSQVELQTAAETP